MCGISGIIEKKSESVSHDDIRAITDLAAHRGPDGEGYYHARHIAFGHRRLAILDLSAAGRQPMFFLDRYVITYNGEVYNYLEIRDELVREGYRFHTGTDTEVILAAYDRWGQRCVERFNGMWAFAIHDRMRQLVFCSRDRFGVKPLYFADQADRFTFASEIKQVLRGTRQGAVVNIDTVRDFLVEGLHGHTNQTFFAGIRSLDAGHNLIFDLNTKQFSETRWYTLVPKRPESGPAAPSTAVQLLGLMQASVRRRLRSDVKVGTCLSGGIDSSSVAALASQMYQKTAAERFQAIHAKASETAIDESAFARQTAEACNIELSVVEPSAEEFVNAIDEVAYIQEEPFASPSIFMQYFVFKKGAEIGCKVMMDGQGGDETLLGYERYFASHLERKEGLSLMRELFAIKRNNAIRLRALVAGMLYFRYANIRIGLLRHRFKFLRNRYLAHFPNIEKLAAVSRSVEALQRMEIEHFQLPHLLRYADRNSMRHSVEVRLPFLDYQLVEWCVGLDPAEKIHQGWTKHILRKAMDGIVPARVLWRRDKLGFTAPSKSWMAQLREPMEQAIRRSPIITHMCKTAIDFESLSTNIKWRLYSIAKWEEIFEVKLAASAPVVRPAMAYRPLPSAVKVHSRVSMARGAANSIV
jgi:asparagine synthase (glutamine-hydrolysing)